MLDVEGIVPEWVGMVGKPVRHKHTEADRAKHHSMLGSQHDGLTDEGFVKRTLAAHQPGGRWQSKFKFIRNERTKV